MRPALILLLMPLLAFPAITAAQEGEVQTQWRLYRADSASGHHQQALYHLLRYKKITDSIFNSNKRKQLGELRARYEVEKKEQALLLQGKDIELLTRQKQLQQSLAEQKSKDALIKQQSINLLMQQAALQKIGAGKQQRELQLKEKDLQLQNENAALLHNRGQLQEIRLKQAHFIRKIALGSIALLLVIVGLLYNQYRIRQRNNQENRAKNDKLNGLLNEKEWLVKEVHHRVKNNLQVVLSLLESQSAYLKDEALAAIHNSQHRVQAMSLIHKKLYQAGNTTQIDMDIYIPELVQYLKESFGQPNSILCRLDIAPVQLDVSQAVPLGLILNEAVSNALKHAFAGREQGEVAILLKQTNDNDIVLAVVDNGIGLPPNYRQSGAGSLGMSLMQRLGKEMNARYSVSNQCGTHIQVAFSVAKPVVCHKPHFFIPTNYPGN